MKIKKEIVGAVVAEASAKMSDPNYSAVLVGGFVQSQRDAAQYLSAHATDFGGAEAVVNAIFHCALIGLCFQRGYGRTVRRLTFDDLDAASAGDRRAALAARQPYVLEYIDANVDRAAMKDSLILIALAMESASR
ncbi:MAG: hypothetical protein D6689_02600 [Deltaproteobacteria bacterium]|nr:MAG: hypothetical protein D6689_02600 [Deltaproteobacteria bacterium]